MSGSLGNGHTEKALRCESYLAGFSNRPVDLTYKVKNDWRTFWLPKEEEAEEAQKLNYPRSRLRLSQDWGRVNLTHPDSVNPFGPVNRESPRDSAILAGVGIRKRAILDADLAERDEQLVVAVNKKPAKTRDLNEKSRDSRLGFLCLTDWLSFEPILKVSASAILFVTILSALKIRKAFP